ncbi:intercellular adhesion molecule 3 isoform X2 [Trichosurus vulpecula]|uniref:intercellular adhesion molecule 3 isoform X2 n=1 Tax=Trichosurus vulpecula TaxID=9337 RepID=UPI00186B08F8|nr:intercellular adhesion molecule 3 isoform X2 [Trichosurus vulpecula]
MELLKAWPKSSLNLLVFAIMLSEPPEHVDLEPLPRWILVGQNFILRCQVWGGKPRQNLTMALLRGHQELSRQPVSEQAPEKTAEVTFTATASREDHGANFSCRAELDLGAQGLELYQKSSAPMELHTFVLGTPRLIVPKLLEVGKVETISCETDKLFPVENAQIHLSLEGRSLSPTVRWGQDTLRATAPVKGQREGQWELTCNVILGDQNREVRGNLTVYKASRDPVPIVMWVLLALGLVVLAGAFASLYLRRTLRRGSYQPQMLPLQDRVPTELPETRPTGPSPEATA